MRTTQQMRAGQHMAMTPQLVQSIRLLQLSATELEQEISQLLEQNVMLEACDNEQDESAVAESLGVDDSDTTDDEAADLPDADDEVSEYEAPGSAAAGDGPAADVAASESRLARALTDLGGVISSDREARIAVAILDAIDDNGYLETSLTEIGASLQLQPMVSGGELDAVLAKVQQLDPPGFGARDLRECLRLQLQALPPRTPVRSLALAIVDGALDLLAAGQHAAIAERFEVPVAAVAEAQQLIRSLDPRPARRDVEAADYVIPDLELRRRGNNWSVELGRGAAPRVRVNQLSERLLGDCGGNAEGLRTQLREARWLVRGLEMRHQTLLRAGRAIFARQAGFLQRGDEGLVSLTLNEVASAIGMHESTVSRITANKYIKTPRGVLSLRHFFCSQVTVRDGVEASGTAVRAVVRRLIDAENHARPLCDGAIAALLSRQGIGVARRTIAKYREGMHIAPAKQRRQMQSSGAVSMMAG
jgi:RNA polymerase sigma-54 factor